MNTNTGLTHTATTTKYSHLEPTGELATRKSKRIYEYVMLVNGSVYSYHRTRELAAKAADTQMRYLTDERYSCYDPTAKATVEMINFGTRPVPVQPKAQRAPQNRRPNVISSEAYFAANGERPSGFGNWSFFLRLSNGTEVYEWFNDLNYKTASKKAIRWATKLAGEQSASISQLYPMP